MYECSIRVLERLNTTGTYPVSFVMTLSNVTDVYVRLGHLEEAEKTRARILGTITAADWDIETKRRVAEVIIRNSAQGSKEFAGTRKVRG